MSELDQIWMPKCFKFGWILPFVPTPFEQGVWKRHYLECVRGLQYMRPKVRVIVDKIEALSADIHLTVHSRFWRDVMATLFFKDP